MKKEVLEITVIHPDKGELKKKIIVTYDEEVYSSAQEAYDKGKEYAVLKDQKQEEFNKTCETIQALIDKKDQSLAKSESDYKEKLQDLSRQIKEAKELFESTCADLENQKQVERDKIKTKSDEFAKWQEQYPTKGPVNIEAYVENTTKITDLTVDDIEKLSPDVAKALKKKLGL